MQELNFEEIESVGGGRVSAGSIFKVFKAFDVGYSIGEAINWVNERTHMGRGEFPPVPRAGHE